MKILAQFLEGGVESARCPPEEARRILRDSFGRLPIDAVLLGWNLPPGLVEACAVECGRAHADLFLWQPLLAGDGVFRPLPEWRTVGADGGFISDGQGREEFTFVCPNRPEARDAVLRRLEEVMAAGFFQGVFLDRIRFPSPAGDPFRSTACFCGDCIRAAASDGLDLEAVRGRLAELRQTEVGRRTIIAALLSPPEEAVPGGDILGRLRDFRFRSIAAIVEKAADSMRERGFSVGLDCFSPTLAPMVGQDFARLSPHCDWIKGMTYVRAFGPAAIPYEIDGLIGWLAASGEAEGGAAAFLGRTAGWELPATREAVRRGGLSSSILTAEINRGCRSCGVPFFTGVELVDLPGICELDPRALQADLEALRAAAPDGIVLSWDLRRILPERLDTIRGILSGRSSP